MKQDKSAVKHPENFTLGQFQSWRIFFHVCGPSRGTVPTLKLQKCRPACCMTSLKGGLIKAMLEPPLPYSMPPSRQLVANLFLVVFTRVPICVSGADLCQFARRCGSPMCRVQCTLDYTTLHTDMKRLVFYLQPFSVPVTEMYTWLLLGKQTLRVNISVSSYHSLLSSATTQPEYIQILWN